MNGNKTSLTEIVRSNERQAYNACASIPAQFASAFILQHWGDSVTINFGNKPYSEGELPILHSATMLKREDAKLLATVLLQALEEK